MAQLTTQSFELASQIPPAWIIEEVWKKKRNTDKPQYSDPPGPLSLPLPGQEEDDESSHRGRDEEKESRVIVIDL